jgi:fused signal recognition particle receptor
VSDHPKGDHEASPGPAEEKTGAIDRLRERLTKSRRGFVENVRRVLRGRTKIGNELYDELEETLIEADLGVATTTDLLEALKSEAREKRLTDPEQLYEVLEAQIVSILSSEEHSLVEDGAKPIVYLFIGVNGSGKTTTIGKLACSLRAERKNVLLAAADTFRAAASEQLAIWSQRAGADIVKHQLGGDPAAVAYDAAEAAVARGADFLMVDTAGRLHTKVNLMEELKKVKRVIGKKLPDAPHETLLVMDATTGQNGLSQARLFTDALDVTGIVLTKLDGTAKGGIVVAIKNDLGIPLKLIGVGEGMDDLRPFEPAAFVKALFE